MTWTRLAALAAAVLVAVCTAATVRADPLKGDPRKCSFNIPAQCARGAASIALRQEMSRRQYGAAYPLRWDAVINCAQAGSLLKWRCTFHNGAQAGTANIWFRALSSGWKRQVTVTLS